MKKILHAIFMSIGLMSISFSQNIDDFTFTDTKGVQHNLYSYLSANKTVVIKFWFRSCGNCQAFSSEFNDMYLENGSNTGNVIFLSMEIQSATNPEIESWLSTHSVSYPACGGASVSNYWGNEWYSVLGSGFTQVVVLDANATNPVMSSIRYSATGYIDATKEAAIRNAIQLADVDNTSANFVNSIYPNPVQNNLIISLSDDYQKSAGSLIELYTITGKKISETVISGLSSEIEFNVNELNSGYYLLKFQQDSHSETHKIQVIK